MCLETGFLFLELVTQHQWSSQEHSVPWVYFFKCHIKLLYISPSFFFLHLCLLLSTFLALPLFSTMWIIA